MSIPLDRARAVLVALRAPQTARLFAQAHAKHVLHEVRESAENFPSFDPRLDDKVTFSGYALLEAGCSIIEHGDRVEGSAAIERAASLLHHVHGPVAKESRASGFHLLVAAMAFYAAGHYSRAFVTIRAIEEQTPAARAIAAYLRKDVTSLIARLNDVLLRDVPEFDDQTELDEWAITNAIARAAALTLEFVFAGDIEALELADRHLEDATVIASCGSHPAWWWIVRLFRLMLRDLGGASPWRVLPPFFGRGLEECVFRPS